MRRNMSIICSIAFLLSGVMMALTGTDPSPGTSNKVAYATTLPEPIQIPHIPVGVIDTGTIDLSEDLVRDLAARKGLLDTVYITKTDTVQKEVTKIKWRNVPVHTPTVEINVTKTRTDTIQVPVYYIATRVENKEDSMGKCISVYELQKVDEICSEINNSSDKPAIELDSGIGE